MHLPLLILSLVGSLLPRLDLLFAVRPILSPKFKASQAEGQAHFSPFVSDLSE